MRTRRLRSFAWLQDHRGVSAVEFALILPMLVTLVAGGYQLVAYIDATRKVSAVAYSVAQLITQATPAKNANTAFVTALDLHFAYDSSMVVFPYMLRSAVDNNVAWWQNISIAYASIQFQQTSANCPAGSDMSSCYTPKMIWVSSGSTGGLHRSCSTVPSAANDSDAPSATTLPRSVFGPGSIIAVDINFTFRPTFGSKYLPSVQISRSVFLQPRYATLVDYDTSTSDGIAVKC